MGGESRLFPLSAVVFDLRGEHALGIGYLHEGAATENPAYSGCWFGWHGGQRVSESAVHPGDLLILIRVMAG